MTLKEWSELWPYQVVRFQSKNYPNSTAMVTPDGPLDTRRREAFNLSDYRVSAIVGGSIWFAPRPEGGAE